MLAAFVDECAQTLLEFCKADMKTVCGNGYARAAGVHGVCHESKVESDSDSESPRRGQTPGYAQCESGQHQNARIRTPPHPLLSLTFTMPPRRSARAAANKRSAAEISDNSDTEPVAKPAPKKKPAAKKAKTVPADAAAPAADISDNSDTEPVAKPAPKKKPAAKKAKTAPADDAAPAADISDNSDAEPVPKPAPKKKPAAKKAKTAPAVDAAPAASPSPATNNAPATTSKAPDAKMVLP